MKHFLSKILVVAFLFVFIQTNAQSELKKANKEFELQAFKLAIESYKEVLEKEPKNLEALSRIADAYRYLNKMDESAQWYKKALRITGVDPINLFYYGQVLMAQGNYERAKEWFEVYAEGQALFGNQYIGSCDFAMSLRGIPSSYRVKKEYINTFAADYGASFYGDQVVFSSARNDIKRKTDKANSNWTGEAKNQLYISGKDANGFLQAPSFLRSDLSNVYNEGPVSYSADSRKVAFTKNSFVNGSRIIGTGGEALSIYIANYSENGDYSEAKAFPYNGSDYSSGFPTLSNDGKTLYFASNRPDGYGGFDIYASYWENETWSYPQNMGPVVNSPGNEITPFLEDGLLYFSSDWHFGLGGLDIFKAEKINGEWNKIYHLGNGVNSPRDDYAFIFSSEKNIGYFSSNRLGGKGDSDIYQISRMTEMVTIKVVDEINNQALKNALVDFSQCGEKSFETDVNGIYTFQALPGFTCEAIIKKKGYDDYLFQVVSAKKGESRSYEVLMHNSDVIVTNENELKPPSNINREGFIGKVLNAGNNASVDKVYIRAIDQISGTRIETMSNENGEYSLKLLPATNYVIRYSKAGFTDTHQSIQTGNGTDKSILGILIFEPSRTSLEEPSGNVASSKPPTSEPDNPTTNNNPSNPDNSIPNTKPTNSSKPNKEDRPADTISPVVDKPNDVMDTEGFAVQVAAVNEGVKVNTNDYATLKGIGNIYNHVDKGYVKIRVGIYPTRIQAEEARKEITQKGFSSAFIVREHPSDMDVVMLELNEQKTKKDKSKIKVDPNAAKALKEYKVRLASYRHPENFDSSKIEDLGLLEERVSGEFTIILLSGFTSVAKAKEIMQQVHTLGFKNAHVVEDKKGRLIRVAL